MVRTDEATHPRIFARNLPIEMFFRETSTEAGNSKSSRHLLADAIHPNGTDLGMNGVTYTVTAEPSPLPEKTP